MHRRHRTGLLTTSVNKKAVGQMLKCFAPLGSVATHLKFSIKIATLLFRGSQNCANIRTLHTYTPNSGLYI
jgi:hypothetical protein